MSQVFSSLKVLYQRTPVMTSR